MLYKIIILQDEDRICQIGSLHKENFASLNDVAEVVSYYVSYMFFYQNLVRVCYTSEKDNRRVIFKFSGICSLFR